MEELRERINAIEYLLLLIIERQGWDQWAQDKDDEELRAAIHAVKSNFMGDDEGEDDSK